MELCKPKEEVLEKIKEKIEDVINDYNEQLNIVEELIKEINIENEENNEVSSPFINFLKQSIQIKKLRIDVYEREFIRSSFIEILEKLGFGETYKKKIEQEIEECKKKIEEVEKIKEDLKRNRNRNTNSVSNISSVVREETKERLENNKSKLEDRLQLLKEKIETFETNKKSCYDKVEYHSHDGNSYEYMYNGSVKKKSKNSFSVSFSLYGMRLIVCVEFGDKNDLYGLDKTDENKLNNKSMFKCWLNNIYVSSENLDDRIPIRVVKGISKDYDIDGNKCRVEIIPTVGYMPDIYEKTFGWVMDRFGEIEFGEIEVENDKELNKTLTDKFREKLDAFTFEDYIKLSEDIRKEREDFYYFRNESHKYVFYKAYLEILNKEKELNEKIRRKWYSKEIRKEWLEVEKEKINLRYENISGKKPFLWYVKKWFKIRKIDRKQKMDYKYFEDGLKKYETAERVRYITVKEYFKKLMDAFDDVWNVVEKVWNESDMKENLEFEMNKR